MDNNDFNHKQDASLRLEREWRTYLSNIYGLTRGASPGGIYALYVRLKTGGTWVAVAKRFNKETGVAEVAFGTSTSVLMALKQLNGSIAADKWKTDMPYKGAD